MLIQATNKQEFERIENATKLLFPDEDFREKSNYIAKFCNDTYVIDIPMPFCGEMQETIPKEVNIDEVKISHETIDKIELHVYASLIMDKKILKYRLIYKQYPISINDDTTKIDLFTLDVKHSF